MTGFVFLLLFYLKKSFITVPILQICSLFRFQVAGCSVKSAASDARRSDKGLRTGSSFNRPSQSSLACYRNQNVC